MKPSDHAIRSIKRYGGVLSDYLEIHEFFDMTKAAMPDMRHRALLHNSMGPFIAVRVFGHVIENSDGRMVDVRQIAEDHIMEDLGRIPEVGDFLGLIPMDRIGEFGIKKTRQRRAD